MRYNINYTPDPNQNFKYLNEVDEITIRYNYKGASLLDFLLLHKEQRVNIYITDAEKFLSNDSIELFVHIKEKYPELNFVLFFSESEKDLLEEVQKKGLKYFFTNYVNLQLNQRQIINLTNQNLVTQLKEIYTTATNQYEIYKYAQNKDESISSIIKSMVIIFVTLAIGNLSSGAFS